MTSNQRYVINQLYELNQLVRESEFNAYVIRGELDVMLHTLRPDGFVGTEEQQDPCSDYEKEN